MQRRLATMRAAGFMLACALAAGGCHGATQAGMPVALSWRVVPATGDDILVEVRVAVSAPIRNATLSLDAGDAHAIPPGYTLGTVVPPASPPQTQRGPVPDRAVLFRTFRVHPGGRGKQALTLGLRWDGGVLQRSVAWPPSADKEKQ